MLLANEQTGTRDRVRDLVSAEGPVTAAEIAVRLGLTSAAVRRHLDALADAGAIEEHEQARRDRQPGRPARAYVLSHAGHRHLGSAYDDLAAAALAYLQEHGGPVSVADFAALRMADAEQRYAARLEGVQGAEARARALAELLSAEGFSASVRPVTSAAGTPAVGLQLCQGHCPVRAVAERFPQLCDAETEAFSRLLGVHVQRLATLAHGEHVCTTYVPTTTPARTPVLDTGGSDTDEREPR